MKEKAFSVAAHIYFMSHLVLQIIWQLPLTFFCYKNTDVIQRCYWLGWIRHYHVQGALDIRRSLPCHCSCVTTSPLSLRGEQIYRCSCWGRICVQARSPVLSYVQLNHFLHLPSTNNFSQLVSVPERSQCHLQRCQEFMWGQAWPKLFPISCPKPPVQLHMSLNCSFLLNAGAVFSSVHRMFSEGLAGDVTGQSGFRMSGCYTLSLHFT